MRVRLPLRSLIPFSLAVLMLILGLSLYDSIRFTLCSHWVLFNWILDLSELESAPDWVMPFIKPVNGLQVVELFRDEQFPSSIVYYAQSSYVPIYTCFTSWEEELENLFSSPVILWFLIPGAGLLGSVYWLFQIYVQDGRAVKKPDFWRGKVDEW